MVAYAKPGLDKSPIFMSHDECDCYVRVEDTYERVLGDYTDQDARREGDYEDLDEFIEGYERVYGPDSWDPHKGVWTVEYEYVGTNPTPA